jgi:hypothetical protein
MTLGILSGMSPDISSSREDDEMHGVYALVLICHTAVILALWIFGRVFAN